MPPIQTALEIRHNFAATASADAPPDHAIDVLADESNRAIAELNVNAPDMPTAGWHVGPQNRKETA